MGRGDTDSSNFRIAAVALTALPVNSLTLPHMLASYPCRRRDLTQMLTCCLHPPESLPDSLPCSAPDSLPASFPACVFSSAFFHAQLRPQDQRVCEARARLQDPHAADRAHAQADAVHVRRTKGAAEAAGEHDRPLHAGAFAAGHLHALILNGSFRPPGNCRATAEQPAGWRL